ncbi:hypothetical protein FVR03_23240 [Pontibacter qinzhouensis]|uniref:Uncharacterized protein n=1 Tax=Pontibacter qinzhouensis TaxID=2603253 RepID=A0A5C8ILJ7_9BACT|nr:hypothetical protein [Pontibacter qinzhouensis]TXK21972.1 hypothetical protein FVR03_23240 [Pontibacter qinzhouensis]
MKNLTLRVFFGLLFSAIGTVSLLFYRDVLLSAIWLSFGNGLLLTDYKLTKLDAQGNPYLQPVPKARFYAGLFLIALAVLLLFLQIVLDIQEVKP